MVSHFVLVCCLAGVSTCLHPLHPEKIALPRFSVSCVSVFGTRGLSIPTYLFGFLNALSA
jgi:hypothetical protein